MKKYLYFPILSSLVCLMSSGSISQTYGALISSNIGVVGNFDATLGGSGTASLTSASGNFRQWVPGPFGTGFHANINVSAPAQTVGLSVPSVTPPTMSSSGTVNMTYDDITPGTPTQINSASLDLNGNQIIPFVINVDPLQLNTSLGNFNLNLTVNGSISDINFQSNGSSPVVGGNGGSYDIPGDFNVELSATVSGVLTNVPLIGSVNLGTLFTLPNTVTSFAGVLPGNVTTFDLEDPSDPFPHDMLANYQALLAAGIQVPLNLPIDVNESASIPNGQSGFSELQVQGNIDAILDLSDVAYNLDGTVPKVLQVPEPTSGLLLLCAVTGSFAFGRRRKV